MKTAMIVVALVPAMLVASVFFGGIALADSQAKGVPAIGLESGDSPAADGEKAQPEKAAEPVPPGKKDGDADRKDKDQAPGLDRSGEDGSGKQFMIRHRKELEGAVGAIVGMAFILMSGVALFALQFLMLITFPAGVERIRTSIEEKRLFSFVLGLVNSVFLLLLIGVLGKAGGPAGGFAVLFLFALIFLAFVGLVGRARQIGGKAAAAAGFNPNPALSLLMGWGIVFFVGIIPVVGWVIAAYWCVSGVGGVVLSLFPGQGKGNTAVKIEPRDDFESPVVKV